MSIMSASVRASVMAALLLIPVRGWAAHPLITDDTATQGHGKFQLEVNGQADSDSENANGKTVKTTGGQMAAALTYGFLEKADLIVGLPYQITKVEEDGLTVANENGISDLTVDLKWRLFEKDGLSLALKPGISLPSGEEDKGLGSGRAGYRLLAVGTYELAPWAFHANLGYLRNENKADEEENLWHVSAAVTYELVKDLRIAADIGREKSRERNGDNDPGYLLGGVIYGLNQNLDLDAGVKYGLNSAEKDLSLLAGVTMRW